MQEPREKAFQAVEASFEENYMTCLRALVSLIERSGGGQGGTA